jgi:hypothetical protein
MAKRMFQDDHATPRQSDAVQISNHQAIFNRFKSSSLGISPHSTHEGTALIAVRVAGAGRGLIAHSSSQE